MKYGDVNENHLTWEGQNQEQDYFCDSQFLTISLLHILSYIHIGKKRLQCLFLSSVQAERSTWVPCQLQLFLMCVFQQYIQTQLSIVKMGSPPFSMTVCFNIYSSYLQQPLLFSPWFGMVSFWVFGFVYAFDICILEIGMVHEDLPRC